MIRELMLRLVEEIGEELYLQHLSSRKRSATVKKLATKKSKKVKSIVDTTSKSVSIDYARLARSSGRGGDSYTLAELREFARTRGLAVSGTKNELVVRLQK